MKRKASRIGPQEVGEKLIVQDLTPLGVLAA